MRDVLTMVLAGGKADALLTLSQVRAKSAVPYGGGFRIIDFTLSNCVNSGLMDINILAQYFPESLKAHIGIGRPWDLNRRSGGVSILEPYQTGDAHWYRGTADALYQNIAEIKSSRASHVLVLTGDHIYRMDFKPLVRQHRSSGADLTVVVKHIDPKFASRFGVVQLGLNNRIDSFEEKPSNPKSNIVSMGMYLFNSEYLINRLEDLAKTEQFDLVQGLIANRYSADVYYAYPYQGYWNPIHSIKDYYEANMGLLGEPEFNIYDEDNPVYTNSPDAPPAKFGPSAKVNNSIIADGAIINGEVRGSIIYPWAYIAEGAVVTDSIVMNITNIAEGASIRRAIIDKRVSVGKGAIIGTGDDTGRNCDYPDNLSEGLTLIGKLSEVPDNFVVGSNCLIDSGIDYDSFEKYDGKLESCESIVTD